MREPIASLKLRRNRREAGEFVFDKFAQLGLSIPGGSRFHAIKSLYESSTEPFKPDNPKYDVVLEAERDIQTMAFVFENCDGFSNSNEFLRLLRLVIKDSALPQSDREGSDGRDNQFHLYVAATCHRAGLLPRLQEPDIVCTLKDLEYGVAVKRIKNAKRLEERILGAAEQIQRARMPGIIACDISMAINRDNLRPDTVGKEDEFAERYLAAMSFYAERNFDSFCRWLKGTETRGVILHDSYVTDARHGDAAFLGFSFGIGTVRHNARREKQFVAFKRQYDTGLHNRQRSI